MSIVRPAALSDAPALAPVLARAFDEDPIYRWIFPDADERRLRLSSLFGELLRHVHLPRPPGLWSRLLGAVPPAAFTTRDTTGAALWHPRAHEGGSLLRHLGLGPRIARVLGAAAPRALHALITVERRHPTTPHHYLAVIGIDPAHHGRGLGGALLGPMLERCDREHVAAYLESSNERNHGFYRRHGFETIAHTDLTRRGPRVWFMWRAPR